MIDTLYLSPLLFPRHPYHALLKDLNGEVLFDYRVVLHFAPGEGASGTVADIAAPYGGNITLPLNGFTAPSGKSFAGWLVQGQIYDPGDPVAVTAERFPEDEATATPVWIEANSDWQLMQARFDYKYAKTVKLTRDVVAGENDENLVLSNANATIDLNGYAINRNLSSPSSSGSVMVIYDGASLTLLDSSAGGTGRITGGDTTGIGGGIVNFGTLNMYGGTITGNHSVQSGGGLVSGHYIQGGLSSEAVLHMYGGAITGNVSDSQAGGVFSYINGDGRFWVSGDVKIADNYVKEGTNRKASNLLLYSDSTLVQFDGSLSEDARIGVTLHQSRTTRTITSGMGDNATTDNLTADVPGEGVRLNANGEAETGTHADIMFTCEDNRFIIPLWAGDELAMPENSFDVPEGKAFLCWRMNDGSLYEAGQTYVGTTNAIAWPVWVDADSTPWARLQQAIDAGDQVIIRLKEDVTAQPGDAPLTVAAGKDIVIDLYGHILDRGMNEAAGGGSAFSVSGKLTLKDTSTDQTGAVTGAKNTENGGAIYNAGTVVIEGGRIAGNLASEGGAVFNASGATLNITGGTFSGNGATLSGGAFANHGTMLFSGGAITGNSASDHGAGIWTDGVLNFTGGTVTGNSNATGNGGGIYFAGGTLNVSGTPVVTDNAPDDIHLLPGEKLTVSGPLDAEARLAVNPEELPSGDSPLVITSGFSGKGALTNFACNAPGIGVKRSAEGEVELSSVVVIHFVGGEDAVGEMEDMTLQMGDACTLLECGFVSIDRKQFAGWRFNGLTKVYLSGDAVAVDSTDILDQQATVTALWADSAWGALQVRINGGNGKTFVLEDNLSAGPTDEALYIPTGCDITIDLNGNYLDRNNRSGETSVRGGAIFVDGTLTLLDSSLGQTGAITGGNARNGGGVCINENATFNMYGGTLQQNYADGDGGGVYVGNNATFNLFGGTITRNASAYSGGGLYAFTNGSKVNVSGTVIIEDNTGFRGESSNARIWDLDNRFNVIGPLSEDSRIGLHVVDDPAVRTLSRLRIDINGKATMKNFFVDGGYALVKTEGGKLTITHPDSLLAPDMVLPRALTAIDDGAFEGIYADVIRVPEGCGAIGAEAFKDNTSLMQIYLPANCAIDDTAFDGCSGVWFIAPAGGSTEAWADIYLKNHPGAFFPVDD